MPSKRQLLIYTCCITIGTAWISFTASTTIQEKNFFEQVEERQERLGTHICLGLDPREEWFTQPDGPSWFENSTQKFDKEAVTTWAKQLINQTENHICCIKPNLAFYTQMGPEGLETLREIIQYSHGKYIPVLLDAKYGDIGSTATAYAKTAFGYLDADCVTLNPYLGYDTIRPFLKYETKAVCILAKTTNPSSKAIQNMLTENGLLLCEQIAQKAGTWGSRVGLVVGATAPDEARRIRAINRTCWILSPGIGSQQGKIAEIVPAIEAKAIFPISRGITANKELCPHDAALHYKSKIEEALTKQQTKSLVADLMAYDIVKFGQFTLKSGALSPIYVDLRSLISYPDLLEAVAKQCVALIHERNISFDRIAGIAYGALGLAFRVAAMLKKPVLLIKKEDKKEHGISNKGLIGHYDQGERVLLIEDVATTGESILRAAKKLVNNGLEVTDAITFLDRESTAEDNLAKNNLTMHTVLTMSNLLNCLTSNSNYRTQ